MSNPDESDVGGAGLAGESDASPEAIAELYDTWASGDYDHDVAGWGYEAPERVAAMLVEQVGTDGLVLDAGCGTGRAGAALRAAGVDRVIGGDFSPASVDAARARGIYDAVDHLDLNAPLPFADQRFAATISVGVFSYLADTAATIGELLRVTRPSGVVIFTQRTDLWAERDCDEILRTLAESGSCSVEISEPQPYLPGHPDFGTEIGIRYVAITCV